MFCNFSLSDRISGNISLSSLAFFLLLTCFCLSDPSLSFLGVARFALSVAVLEAEAAALSLLPPPRRLSPRRNLLSGIEDEELDLL